LIKTKEISEIKGNRFPIGSYKAREEEKFNNHKVDIKNNDSIYIFSNGYVDQFGGSRGKKIMVIQLINTLYSISKFETKEQGQHLNQLFEDWKGI
jgi:hypothetical protein